LFAAGESRAPVLGVYALQAEWRALMDPATEAGVARIKLAWWHDEMCRLADGSPVHPISRFLAALPSAADVDFAPLRAAVQAAAAHIDGVPLEVAADLGPHAEALYGIPLALAARLADGQCDATALRNCTAALAAGEYLARAIADYRRDAQFGRVPFAVDELLTAGVENSDLLDVAPPARLREYLDRQRARAAVYFDTAAEALAPADRSSQRFLSVLAKLGSTHSRAGTSPLAARFRLRDVYVAWVTARRAARQP
jgi:phytoene synthase